MTRLVVLLWCAGILPAAAQGVATPLDIDTAVARALARHPAVAAARAGASGASAQTQSTARFNSPVLKLSADREDASANGSGTTERKKLGVEWAPPQWGETALRLEQLQHGQRQQSHRLEQVRQQVALEVRRAHLGMAGLNEMVAASEQLRRLAQALVNRGTEQVQQGRRSQQALVDLRVQALELDSQHQALLAQRSQQEAELRALLGLEPGDSLVVPSTPARTPDTRLSPAGDPDTIAAALRQRPELKAAQARCDAVRVDAQLKGMDNQRWLKSLGMEHTPRQQTKPASWGVALEINLPVPGDKNGSTAALQSAVETCQAETQDLQRMLRRDVLSALQQWQAAARELQMQQDQTLPLLQQAVELAKATRRAGRGDALDVLTAEMAYTRGRVNALRRQLDLQWAELLWQHAAGRPLAGPSTETPTRASGG